MDAETIRQRNAAFLRAKMLASRAQETVIRSHDAIARSEQLLKELYELRRRLFGERYEPLVPRRTKKAKR